MSGEDTLFLFFEEEQTMKYNRTYNFSAGPATMPEPVTLQGRERNMELWSLTKICPLVLGSLGQVTPWMVSFSQI